MERVGYYRDTWVEVHLNHIYENITLMKKHLPGKLKTFAVVKANAYGHGDLQIAETALEAGADYLAVAFLDEALALRKKGITVPILVLGATRPENAELAAKEGIALTVFQEEWLASADTYLSVDSVLNVHLKCDTGMGRIGVRSREEIEAVESRLEGNHKFYLQGVYTHFATADGLELAYYQKQLNTFKQMLGWLKQTPELVHAANSATALRFPDASFNAVRMGISMYGLCPSIEMEELLPFPLQQAIALKTKIVAVKRLTKGESVSYGATYTALEDEWIATLPIGYADGWIRKLQGQEVIVHGEKAPIVGRICMDQCMIRLSQKLPIGTEVTLIGGSDGLYISVDEIAKRLETINYEVTCMIASRVPRVYIKDGEITQVVNGIL